LTECDEVDELPIVDPLAPVYELLAKIAQMGHGPAEARAPQSEEDAEDREKVGEARLHE
jgi:hypothetical protein